VKSVVHIGTADNSGGAARAAFRIHSGLGAEGWHSRILCGHSVEPPNADIAVVPKQTTLLQRAFRLAVNTAEETLGMEYLLLPWKNTFLRHPFVRQADIVHLHNLHGGFFSPSVLPKLGRARILVWSIHDMWPLTGHCYYPDMYGCVRWKSGCGSCPGLRQENHYPLSIDTTAYLWKNKKRLYAETPITLVGQSRWTMEQIQASPLLGDKPARLIPYGLDTALFRPMERAIAREILRLPKDATIVFFSAIGLNSERKGWKYLNQALQKIRSQHHGHILLMTAGDLPPADLPGHRADVISLGYIRDDRMMALAYNAADVFVGSSVVETFGQVYLEAMACGIPSVAFDTSGVRDVIRHMETGYLARLLDSADLTAGLTRLLDDPDLRSRMGAAGRRIAEQEYSLEIQAKRYACLYEELTRSSPSPS
jgi:glycosyltransferase involved in cell wall biosynthesis